MHTQYDYFFGMDNDALERFFKDEQTESETIEFKSGGQSLNNVYKELCAFANTDGGVLVYGAPIEDEKRKACVGELSLTKESRSEDSMIQSIRTGISPALNDVKVKKFEYEGGNAYVIYIGKSKKAPHQVNGTYYIRVGTMSERANHGIVEALFYQMQPIDLNVEVNLIQNGHHDLYDSSYCDIQVIVSNETDFPARNIEGAISIVGPVRRERRLGETDRITEMFTNGKHQYLFSPIAFEGAVALDLFTRHTLYNLYVVDGDYFYMKVYVWAEGVKMKVKSFKVYMSGSALEVDLEGDFKEAREYEKWSAREDLS